MNRKGFAISVILYSIILLIVVVLYMLLGIVRTRYVTNSKLRDNVVNKLNTELTGNVFKSDETCTISGSASFVENLVLTINVSNYGKSYKFNNGVWSTDNTIVANHAGIYMGYFRDNRGGEGNCRAEVTSQTMYRYRDCSQANREYGEWYKASVTTSSGCSPVTQASAEQNNTDEYITCSGTTKTTYKRDFVRCNFTTETWSSWSNTYPSVPVSGTSLQIVPQYRDVESKTLYRMK